MFEGTKETSVRRTGRWEYVRIQFDSNKIKDSDAAVDELGREGWELVSAVFTNTYLHLWFKRPKR